MPFDGPAAAGPSPSRLFDELRRIALAQLGPLPGALFDPIEARLNDAIRRETEQGAGLGGEQREDLMLLRVLRQRGAAHVMRYREQLARGFDEFAGHAPPPSDDALGLVAESELEFRLASERTGEAIAREFQPQLEPLERDFAVLSRGLGVAPKANPVDPMHLADAFVHAFGDADLSRNMRDLLVDEHQLQLSKVLAGLYPRLAAEFAAAGYASAPPPRRRPERAGEDARESPAGSASPSSAGSAQATSAAPGDAGHDAAGERLLPPRGAAAPDTNLFTVPPEARDRHRKLRDMLQAWRSQADVGAHGSAAHGASQLAPAQQAAHATGRGDAGDTAPAHELSANELVAVVSLLQRDVYEPFERSLAGSMPLHQAIREHLHDGAARLGHDAAHTRIARHDADAIDLVGLLFEALLDSRGMPADARSLFARLVMTYVRVALVDDNLFVRPGHPAKRLLDALALSCEDNAGATTQEQELMQRAQQVVERVVAEYNEDLAIFDLGANELQEALQRQRKRTEIVERRAAEKVQGREKLLQARLQAGATLAQHVSGRELTATLARFLERYWVQQYQQALLRGGAETGRAAEIRALADSLVALDAKARQALGGEVADRLLGLEDAIRACLSNSGLDEAAANEWLAGLARSLAFPDASREVPPPPGAPRLQDDAEDMRLLRMAAATEPDAQTVARMQRLRPGDWLRMPDEEGQDIAVKVAWISPLTSRVLLVNRRGVRKFVASAQQLAALAARGVIALEPEEPLPFDAALQHVRDRLGDDGDERAPADGIR